jgi:hypothetical protein
MKKFFFLLLFLNIAFENLKAQDEEKNTFFKKENFFTGGSATGNFNGGAFSVGLVPFFGYSINNYLDVAVSLNYSYYSRRNNIVIGDKYREFSLGPGAFIRVFPFDFLYFQAQIESNFTKQKYIYPSSFNLPNDLSSFRTNSYLVGAGFSNGRNGAGGSPYSYVSILFDLGNDFNTPYTDQIGRKIPLLSAGINIPLFQGGNGSRKRRNTDD